MKITEISQNLRLIEVDNDHSIYLLGTAHISAESIKEVEIAFETIQPNRAFVELDQDRYNNLTKDKDFSQLDIFQIIKQKKLALFISQFLLSMLQKRMSEKTGSKPGMEFVKAIEIAQEKNIDIHLIDRNVSITLNRLWRSLSFWNKMKLLASMFAGTEEELSTDTVEELKQKDILNEYLQELATQFPKVAEILIYERDSYMVNNLKNNLGEKNLVVIGAGHAEGMTDKLLHPEKLLPNQELDIIPPKTILAKSLPWIIPILILSLFVWGFTRSDITQALNALYAWIIINGSLSALGCLIALGHPITIISGFIVAPITSLNPTIGAGFVTAIVQTFLVKPRVMDFMELKKEGFRWYHWWKNRLTRIFLVFILSSLGSAIGTWVAMPYLAKIF